MDSFRYGRIGGVVATVLFSLFAGAKETVLTVTDGVKWSTGTWSDGEPASGDTVILRNQSGAAAVVENDLLSDPAEIAAEGNAAITLKGLSLTLSGGRTGYKNKKSAVTNGVPFTVDVPIAFVQNSSVIHHGETLTFNGDITIADDLTLYVYRHWCNNSDVRNVYFNGSITGLNATYGHCTVDNNNVYFRKPVKVKSFYTPSDGQGYVHFQSAGNSFGSYSLGGGQTFWEAANATTPPVPVSWAFMSDTYYRGAHWLVTDQTFDGLAAAENPWSPYSGGFRRSMNVYSRGRAVTLTLRNTKDAGGAARLGGSREDNLPRYDLNLVYDPTGSFTQRFSDRAHELNGSITVKGGTLLFSRYVEFPNLTKIDVQDGTFELSNTNKTTVLPALKRLTVASGATFRIGADVPADGSTLAAHQTILAVAGDATVEIANGATLPFYLVYVDGVCQYPNVELTKDNTTWIKGTGKVKTDAEQADMVYWKDAADGNWHDATKWVVAPTNTNPAYATYCGGAYVVSLDPAQAWAVPSLVTISGWNSETSTVALTAGALLQGWNVSVGTSGALKTTTATLTNNTITVDGGGTFRVTGATEYAGTYESSPLTVRENGTLEVTDGTLTFNDLSGSNGAGKSPLKTLSGARLNVSGSGRVRFYSPLGSNKYRSCPYLYGQVDISGQANFEGWGCYLYATDGETSTFTLRDHATMTINQDGVIRVGDSGLAGFCRMDIDSDQYTKVPYSGTVAVGQNAEMNIRNGHLLDGRGNLWRIGQAQGCTGTVNVIRGGLKQYAWSQYDRHLYGIAVGDASTATVAGQKKTAYGFLNVHAGGAVSNMASATGIMQGMYLRIGTGNAVGTFNLLGGEYYHDSRFQAYVGGFAGTGTWLLASNAVARLTCDVYVGGCVTNDLCGFREAWQCTFSSSYGNGGPNFAPYFDQTSHTAKGTLTVESGRFLCSSNLYTSVDGTGKLAFGEDPDAFLCARNVTLSNTTDQAGNVLHATELTFTSGPNGVARLVAGSYGADEVPVADGTLTIAAGTTLKVDFSRFDSEAARTSRIPVIQYANRVGDFASIDVISTPADERKGAKLVEKTFRGVKGYYYCVTRGMLIMIR